MSKYFFGAALAALFAVPGVAQANEDQPLAGPKVGIEVVRDTNKVSVAGTTFSATRNGPGIRGFAGYDAVIGDSFLVGGEIGIGTAGKTTIAVTGPGLAGYEIDPGRAFDATARAGVVLGKRVALYGRIGARWLHGKVGFVSQTGVLSVSKTNETGFTYGGGAEYALTGNFSVRAEFNRTNFAPSISQNKLSLGATLRF